MGRRTFETLGEILHWSYANLAMADAALRKGDTKYGPLHFMIRAKLYKGLSDGTMSLGSLLLDERVKLLSRGRCSYCGSEERPSIDHLFARAMGGSDDPENLVFSCMSCNSSKGKKDALAWAASRGSFLPLSVIRRYLKLAILYSREHGVMAVTRDSLAGYDIPFAIEFVPLKYPNPTSLVWSY